VYSAYSRLGVRKSLKDIASRRARRKRQKAEYRRQKTGDRRGFEGWKKRRIRGVKDSEKRRIRGVKDSRGQVEKDRRLEGWKVRGLVKK
jgi:hypothetical protein